MGKRAGLDVTVVNTMSASYVCTPAANDAKHALKAAVDTKEKRHRDECEAAGYDYYTAGWTVFGAVFGGFFDSLVKPHYKHAKAMAKRNGEDPWQVQARQGRVMDRWSVVIARYNAKAIQDAVWRDSAVDDWPSTPERNDCLQDIDGGAVA
jgi:hypothetical protein